MTNDLNPHRELNLRPLRSSLAGWSKWESTPVDAVELGKLAWKLGFGHFDKSSIRALWRIGLLRADVVTAEIQIDALGFEPVVSPDGYRFIDVEGVQNFV